MRTIVDELTSFDSIIGNTISTSMLQNIIDSNNIAPAYLFTGKSGIGKFKTAVIFANKLVESDFEILIVKDELINIEEIRETIKFASTKPTIGNRKVIIIDAETKLSEKCSNALLKLLQDTPSHTIVIIVSSYAVLPTIKSRCHTIEFLPLTNEEIVSVMTNHGCSEIQESMVNAAQGSAKLAIGLSNNWNILNPFIQKLSTPPKSILTALEYSNEICNLYFNQISLLIELLAFIWWNNGNQNMLTKVTTAKKYLDARVYPGKILDELLMP